MSPEIFSHNSPETEIQLKPILRIVLQRHGPKLFASGEKNETAEYFDMSVQESFGGMEIGSQGLVHISSSPVNRAFDTATINLDQIHKTDLNSNNRINKRHHLSTPYQSPDDLGANKYSHDYTILVEMQKRLEPEIRARVDQSKFVSPEQTEAEVRNQLDMEILNVLFDKEKADRLGLQVSYEENAESLARRYSGFLRHLELLLKQKEAGKQHDGEPYKQIDVSHSFPIMCFLKKYLIFDDGAPAVSMEGKEFFRRTGGVIRESSFITMDFIKNDNQYIVRVKGPSDTQINGKLTFEDKYEQ